MTTRIALVGILTACLMAVGTEARGARGAWQDKKEDPKGAKSQSPATPGQIGPEDTSYKIGPQDVLIIDVWKEEGLTRTVPVRPDGKITLPLLNDIQAVGLTPMELAGIISEQLKKYITSPQVTVSVTEINSRRVYVTGEVLKGGAYALLPHMTVLQALSSSGGFTQFARVKSIYVLRTDHGKQTKVPFNYKEAVNGKNPGQNIELLPGDVIVVP
jgi:polysaccharide export outer membrane protein